MKLKLKLKLKFTRDEYFGSPCWELEWPGGYADVEWNTRFPGGFSFGVSSLRRLEGSEFPLFSFCLDANAPLGEPNRIYTGILSWFITVGLLSMRSERFSGRRVPEPDGAEIWEHYLTWPHIDGISRYHYHQNESGEMVRNDCPEKWHWGWLTVENRGERNRKRTAGTAGTGTGS